MSELRSISFNSRSWDAEAACAFQLGLGRRCLERVGLSQTRPADSLAKSGDA